MTAEIIPFARYRCDCDYCRAVAEVWYGTEGPAQISLVSFLDENAHLLPRRISPFTALGIIAGRGSPMSRSLARTILDKTRYLVAAGNHAGNGDGPDAA